MTLREGEWWLGSIDVSEMDVASHLGVSIRVRHAERCSEGTASDGSCRFGLKLYGSEPANFLDVGGSASQEAVQSAFKILVSDPKVKAVLINIFGGIARTDRIARGVVAALDDLGEVQVPVVVRLEGTNVEIGRQILQDADFDFIVADQMADAAEKVVAAAKGVA